MGRRIIINITKGEIYLNPSYSIAVSETNLSEGEVSIKKKANVFWEVEITNDNTIGNTLSLKVTNYRPGSVHYFSNQQIQSNWLKLHFRSLDWGELEPLLSSYKQNALLRSGIILNQASNNLSANTNNFSRYSEAYHYSSNSVNSQIEKPIEPAGEEETVQSEYIMVPYIDCEFRDGELIFSHLFLWHNAAIEFIISNSWLRKEYDYIKDYFSRFIGQKGAFRALIKVTLYRGNVQEALASSEDISKIDSTIIDKVKYQRVVNLLKTPVHKERKSLFTTEDIFQNFERKAGNVFEQTAQEILNQIIRFKKVRNEKQLAWLSKEIQPVSYKLRFTLTPLFGFVFYIPGTSRDFFCWELLETNATYLWGFDRTGSAIDELYEVVEGQIKIIEEIGREQYKRNRKNQVDVGFIFLTIDHRINGESEEIFDSWKKKLDKIVSGDIG